jgi:hypothetical protein
MSELNNRSVGEEDWNNQRNYGWELYPLPDIPNMAKPRHNLPVTRGEDNESIQTNRYRLAVGVDLAAAFVGAILHGARGCHSD